MTTSPPLESAVVVLIGVESLEAIYRETYPVMVEQGIPLHVTLHYPFVSPEALPAALPRLGAVVARHEQFEFELTELRTFPEHIWVAPEPAAQFSAITASIDAEFPDHPHWKGEFAEVIPHMTLARADEGELDATLARLRPRIEPLLPLRLVAEDAAVLAESANGQWYEAARLPLSASRLH